MNTDTDVDRKSDSVEGVTHSIVCLFQPRDFGCIWTA
jgi:hypothetical protein